MTRTKYQTACSNNTQNNEVSQCKYFKSLNKDKLLEMWKKANIVSLYEKVSKQRPLNYRPASPTSVVSKIIAKLIRKRWLEHLENYEKLSEKLFGFIKKEIVRNKPHKLL